MTATLPACPAVGASPSAGGRDVLVVIPIHDDWNSVLLLLAALDRVARGRSYAMSVLLVDDGSPTPPPASLRTWRPDHLRGVDLLVLRQNLGHQRAIAVGLVHAHDRHAADVVVVMDGDGEDAPEDVPRLVARVIEDPGRIVFASRERRSEGPAFRAGYRVFQLLFRAATGRPIRIGNFSAIPGGELARLLAGPEIWNHYAAAVMRSRRPFTTLPTRRRRRLDGRSHMSFLALVLHGLAAISVFGDTAAARLLTATGLLLPAVGAVVCWLPTGAVSPPSLAAMALVWCQAIVLQAAFLIHLLAGRSLARVNPLRDAPLQVLTSGSLTMARPVIETPRHEPRAAA